MNDEQKTVKGFVNFIVESGALSGEDTRIIKSMAIEFLKDIEKEIIEAGDQKVKKL